MPDTPDRAAEIPETPPTRTPLDLEAVRSRLDGRNGQSYWRSLEELAETPEFNEFLAKEFPRQAAPLESSLDRRSFVKLLGASLALAGLTSCVRPYEQEKFAPYVRAPEELVPDEPIYFATALTHGGYGQGTVVESHQGRPIKIEGNPDHPDSLGRTSPYMQAQTLTLYDPDRSQFVVTGGEASSFDAFFEVFGAALDGLQSGTGLHLLTETVTSPTLARQLADLLRRYPGARWHQFDPLNQDPYVGTEAAFGEPLETRYDFSQADTIVSFGGDFLGPGPGQLAYSAAWAESRRVRRAEDEMSRMYVLESSPTLTGSVADHRIALRPSAVGAAVRALAGRLGVAGVGETELPEGLEGTHLEAMVADLQAAQGRSVVVVGPEQPAAVQALGHAINAALGNVGATVLYTDPVAVQAEGRAGLRPLVEAMRGGEVQLLLILGGNPAYTAPADLSFAEALERVPLSAHLSLYRDETSVQATWHLPMTHELETWSDARAFDGTVSILQPLIAEPFFNGISAHQLLAAILGDPDTEPIDLVRATYEGNTQEEFETFWRGSVYRGVVAGTALEPRRPELRLAAGGAAPEAGEGLEVMFRLDPSVLDGRYGNNGWLQELPRPFSKITWDNAALIAPALAQREGLSNHDVVRVTVEGRSLELPVWIMPGQADNTVLIHVGYGRESAGHIGTGVGVNANLLRTAATYWHATGAGLAATGRTFQLATTQLHHSITGDDAEQRHIVRHGTLAQLREEPEHPHFVHPVEHPESDLYDDWRYPQDESTWGMVVDMTVCTSCNACVVACQAENNIPVVGKEQVQRGREMQWIRIDAYYSGSLDAPNFYNMPMMCQHCEQAPCEPVCPVGATIHDHEGLNVMVYNRCVGTRYCSNNCPYKVRRFNFLQYAELTDTSLAMLANPNVTVRSRGVMEKCTYCVQRIRRANITASNERRDLRPGEVVSACAAACPTQAIVFGNLHNPEERVVQDKRSALNYGVLTELNTQPRTTYLAKMTNPNPALSSAEPHAEARREPGLETPTGAL